MTLTLIGLVVVKGKAIAFGVSITFDISKHFDQLSASRSATANAFALSPNFR